MIPSRGNLLVKPVETEECIPGGKIVLTANAREQMAAYQCEVVSVGLPEACDDYENCNRNHALNLTCEGPEHPLDARLSPGAWVYCRPRSLVDASHPTERLYFIRQSDVLAVFSIHEETPAG